MEDKNNNIEEIEAEYKKFLAKKTEFLKKEVEIKEAEMRKQQEEIQMKDEEEKKKKWLASELDRLGIKPNTGVLPSTSKKIEPENKELAFMKKLALKQGIKRVAPYEIAMKDYQTEGIIAFTNSDSGCDNTVSDWEVADCFADIIWESVICHSDFLSKGITVKGLDFNAGCGGKVQLRVISVASPSADFGSDSACNCLSCVSNTFSTYTLTLEAYGDYKVLCDLDLFTAGDAVKSAVINSMKSRAAERIDNKIYSVLSGATPTYSETLGASATCSASRGTDGACCTFTVDLYDRIVDLEAEMRGAGYFREADPVLIISPTIAAFLKYKDGLNMPSYIAANIQMDGLKLAGIGNIKVIESCHATACTDGGAAVIGILIDPSRAIGEAWGKKPTFKFDDDPIECGSQKIVLRMWADFAILDPAATGHILNP